MDLIISSSFFPLLARQERYLVLYGGRGSGKSEFAARKTFARAWGATSHQKFLIMRKFRTYLKGSVIEVFLTLLNDLDINYEYNKSDRIIKFTNPNGYVQELIFDGIDDPEKIKSVKGICSIWLEETTEFSKQDFVTIDLSLREKTESYKQIIMTFNPDEAKGPWLKKMFFDGKGHDYTGPGLDDSYLHHSTIEDNPIDEVKKDYYKQLNRLDDRTHIEVYKLGRWAIPKGQIYNWDLVQLPTPDFDWYDEIWYGVDFGYSVDPAVLVRIYRKADEFWVEQLIYERGLTNPQFAQKMKEMGVKENDEVFCDSAEPKSIQELKDRGIRGAKPCRKGADSVKSGIDYLKSIKIHIVDGSDGDNWDPDENIWKERQLYKWKEDKDGNILPVPVDVFNHAMSAVRYGIDTKMRGHKGAFIWFSIEDAY